MSTTFDPQIQECHMVQPRHPIFQSVSFHFKIYYAYISIINYYNFCIIFHYVVYWTFIFSFFPIANIASINLLIAKLSPILPPSPAEGYISINRILRWKDIHYKRIFLLAFYFSISVLGCRFLSMAASTHRNGFGYSLLTLATNMLNAIKCFGKKLWKNDFFSKLLLLLLLCIGKIMGPKYTNIIIFLFSWFRIINTMIFRDDEPNLY